MNIKKNIIIILIVAVLITIAIIAFVNINSLKETTTVSPESKERAVAEKVSVPANAVPANAVPSTKMIEDSVNKKEENLKILKEKEAEAERIRNTNRAEIFEQQKALESSLMNAETEGVKQAATPPLPKKKNANLPSAEELKAMEEKGVVSY